MRLLLPVLLLASALASGLLGAWISVAIRGAAPWWLSLVAAAGAASSWAWTVRAWPGSLIVASVLWNVFHDVGEYGWLIVQTRPRPGQVIGVALVVVGSVLVTAFERSPS